VTDSRPQQRPGWLNGCLILLGVSVLFFVVLLILVGVGGRARDRSTGLPFGQRVGLIELNGEITESRRFLEELKRLEDDPRVAALVLRIDSPGGGVAATQEIYHALQQYHEATHHPVVASLGSLAASGGYYAACAAQKIVTEPGTLTGSIGVIFSFADASELMKKIGVHVEVVKSGAKKDFGAYWRPLTADEQSMLQGIVGDVYDQFTEAVGQSRGIPLEKVRELADGRILSGRQAVQAGLADTLGFQSDAVAIAAAMAGLPPETSTVSKRRLEMDWLDMVRRLAGRTEALLGARPRLDYR
jgi:protease IV